MICESSQARHHEFAATSFQATGHIEAVIKEPALESAMRTTSAYTSAVTYAHQPGDLT